MFCYCWSELRQHQGCLFLRLFLQQAEELGRGHSWDSRPQRHQWDIPNHMTLCSATTAGQRRRKWRRQRHSELRHLYSNIAVRHDGALLSSRWLNTCCSMGSGEWIPRILLFAYVALVSLLNFVLAHNFPHFYPFDSLFHTSEREGVSGQSWTASHGLTHNILKHFPHTRISSVQPDEIKLNLQWE